MDNITHDNLSAGEAVETGINLIRNLADRRLAKQALDFDARGKYWNLNQKSKSLISIPTHILQETAGKGITQKAILELPPQGQSKPYPGTTPEIIKTLQLMSGTAIGAEPMSTTEMEAAGKELLAADKAIAGVKVKQALPYIIGAAVIGILIYFISKK